jgi:hypothetical protein
MTKPKAIVKPAVSDSLKGKWFVVVDDSSRYLRHDMTLHQNMMGEGGTYFDTREEAQELADRFNGDLPHTDDLKTWGEMTDAEKGALLLAHHEGKVIEWNATSYITGEWTGWGGCDDDCLWDRDFAYRVRQEPKRETVALCWRKGLEMGEIGTIDLVDGDPDCDSIRMEALDND